MLNIYLVYKYYCHRFITQSYAHDNELLRVENYTNLPHKDLNNYKICFISLVLK